MTVRLENGINSLIAYYFKMTRFNFLDEYDLQILLNLANMCGIQISIDNDKNTVLEIYKQFLSKLDQKIEGTWHKGIIGTTTISSTIWNSEKRSFEVIGKLQIKDNFTRKVLTRSYGEQLQIVSELIDFFDSIIGSDRDILLFRMPSSDLLKKYMTLKKIVLCKTPYNNSFYENIPSSVLYDSFDDWSTNFEDRGIYPETYQFIEDTEKSFLQLNESLMQEVSTNLTKQQLGRRLIRVLNTELECTSNKNQK